jgi:hypothetical protein
VNSSQSLAEYNLILATGNIGGPEIICPALITPAGPAGAFIELNPSMMHSPRDGHLPTIGRGGRLRRVATITYVYDTTFGIKPDSANNRGKIDATSIPCGLVCELFFISTAYYKLGWADKSIYGPGSCLPLRCNRFEARPAVMDQTTAMDSEIKGAARRAFSTTQRLRCAAAAVSSA